mmetsp:Transcript_13000/g.15777  ORF Transcript_13000/g.15777 Transcript_13000/m.15777 type:complete len:268 (+) Transcript_13000:288-1091(+)|eukprot:CAMPEP_0184012822 /NCGR_PEP_ID=MMETSP0954-20121128/4654_1 /TAXON_ID=627963 /ORGANISM="Aplanochytrium sp, Strain PBS07" /LENGTH=267 /DNA_ID=CAMNT_0026292909 /DNA_START=284 /DNA_END=1087 /DNA_ORIENTATION=-
MSEVSYDTIVSQAIRVQNVAGKQEMLENTCESLRNMCELFLTEVAKYEPFLSGIEDSLTDSQRKVGGIAVDYTSVGKTMPKLDSLMAALEYNLVFLESEDRYMSNRFLRDFIKIMTARKVLACVEQYATKLSTLLSTVEMYTTRDSLTHIARNIRDDKVSLLQMTDTLMKNDDFESWAERVEMSEEFNLVVACLDSDEIDASNATEKFKTIRKPLRLLFEEATIDMGRDLFALKTDSAILGKQTLAVEGDGENSDDDDDDDDSSDEE